MHLPVAVSRRFARDSGSEREGEREGERERGRERERRVEGGGGRERGREGESERQRERNRTNNGGGRRERERERRERERERESGQRISWVFIGSASTTSNARNCHQAHAVAAALPAAFACVANLWDPANLRE